jgi:hypothetical protein
MSRFSLFVFNDWKMFGVYDYEVEFLTFMYYKYGYKRVYRLTFLNFRFELYIKPRINKSLKSFMKDWGLKK